MKLYFSKGSSALAAHILLEEAKAEYTLQEISIAEAQHLTAAFLRINPKGRIPALQTAEGVITENPAILEYIAATQGHANLMPVGAFAQARARAICAYLCATTHVAFAHGKRGSRWVDDPVAEHAMRQKVPENLAASAAHLEADFGQGPWTLGAQYSFCDPYLFLLGGWMAAQGQTLDPYPKLVAHHAAMRAREATKSVLALHGLS